MGANVWQLSAAVGDTVGEGDVLMILESMKMEIPVEAPCAGTVAEIRVAEKDQVGEGDVLVVLTSGAPTATPTPPIAATTATA
jgi:biotin carboxyl carrier protein